MLVWGGNGTADGGPVLRAGEGFDPATGNWSAITAVGAPPQRNDFDAFWTGSEMLLFGGEGSSGLFNDMYGFSLGRSLYLYVRP